MAAIIWNDALSVGIDLIDEDHKLLIEQLNLLATSDLQDTNLIASVIDALWTYTREHFAREEDLMRKSAYPRMEDHLRQHKVFVAKLTDVQRRHQAGEVPGTEALTFLQVWLSKHICKTDRRLGEFLHSVGNGISPTPVPSDVGKLRVLIADDQMSFRTLLRNVLRTMGVSKIEDARNSNEALTRMTMEHFDVVLVDGMLTPSDGLVLTRQLRRLDTGIRNPRAVVIVMPESMPDKEWVLRANDAGVHDILLKPLSMNDLRARLLRHVQNPLPMRQEGNHMVVERLRTTKRSAA